MKERESYSDAELLQLLRTDDKFYTLFRKLHWQKLNDTKERRYSVFIQEGYEPFNNGSTKDASVKWRPATDPMELALGDI